MIPADVKAYLKQPCNFSQEVPSRIDIQCKQVSSFLFNFTWYFIQLDVVSSGQRKLIGRLLNGQNLLIVLKVNHLLTQSLTYCLPI